MDRQKATTLTLLGIAVLTAGMAANTLRSRALPRVGPTSVPASELSRLIGRGISVGPIGAGVVIVEFADFECPFCAQASDSITRLLEEVYPRARLLVRHLPLVSIHQNAWFAAIAAECYEEQGLFDVFRAIVNKQIMDGSYLDIGSIEIGVTNFDRTRFEECATRPATAEAVSADMEMARSLGLGATPTFVVGDRIYGGPSDFANLRGHVMRLIEKPE